MIWDLIEESQFDKHFSDPNLELTTLLLDENIITELKNQNPKLLLYLQDHKHHFITQLIQYTVVMPQESEGYDRGHRLPYISSQLLAIDSDLIYIEFFPNGAQSEDQNPYWLQLIAFLETPAAQNEILMGYFEKVLNNLYNGNKVRVNLPQKQTTKVVAHHLHRFLPLLHNGSIDDILKKCMILLNTPEGAALDERKAILHELIHHLVSGEEKVKATCSEVLSQIVNKFQAFSSGDIIVETLLSSEELLGIYGIDHSPAINDFLVSLLKKSQQRVVNQKDESVKILSIPLLHQQHLSQHLKRQIENLSQLLTSDSYIINQNKVLVRKSNKKIYSLLELASLTIQQALSDFVSSKFISNLWNLIILYPYNNILQVTVIKIFTSILKESSIRNNFLDRYEDYLLELFKTNFQMFRPLIFTIWKEAKAYPTATTDPQVLQSFSALVKQHLQPMLKYEVNKNSINHHHQINNKLIVDEEDKQPTQESQTPTILPASIEQSNERPVFSSDQKTLPKDSFTPPKDSFDFFVGWETENKQAQTKKQNLFDDFKNFF